MHRHAQRSHEAGYVHVAIRFACDILNELYGSEYNTKRNPVYWAINRGQLRAATDEHPIQIEEDELVRWITEDFTGPR